MQNGELISDTYLITSEIGQGGVGVVYLAYHTRLQKYVVLKRIKSCFTDNAFLRAEADILKSLHHTYLPQVYDFMQNGAEVYTVIDYIEGYDLEKYIKSGTVFDERQLLKWAKQLCEVLEYLHTRESPIIHSDIKPSNIIVTPQGDICLIDFNISLDGCEDVRGYSREYASPEQFYKATLAMNNDQNAAFVDLDARTDIYSLGATLYRLVSGITPDVEMGTYPLASISSAYSEAFRALIDKAMNQNPKKRFQSAASMLHALQNLKKLDLRYKKYFIIQVSSTVFLSAVFAFGVFLSFFGLQKMETEKYNAAYEQLIIMSDAGDAVQISRQGDKIMYDFDDYLKKNSPAALSAIPEIVGSCLYDSGDYSGAVTYYKTAMENVENNESPEKLYQNYAVTLVRLGKTKELEALMSKADQSGINTDKFLLLKAQIALQAGNIEDAEKLARECVRNEKLKQIKRSAYLLLAELYESEKNYQAALEAVEQAQKIKQDANILRRMADYNALLGYYSKAVKYLISLKKEYSFTFEDTVNLSKLYRLMNDTSESISLLKQAETDYAEDNSLFIILFQMALSYDKAEYSPVQIQEILLKARKAYDSAPDTAKEKLDPADYDLFKELEDKYTERG